MLGSISSENFIFSLSHDFVFVYLRFLKHSPSGLNLVTCGWLNIALQKYVPWPQTENSGLQSQGGLLCSPSRLSGFLNGVCLHTSKDLFWRAKMTFDPTPQLIANCQTFTAATSSLQQEHFPLPCGSVGKKTRRTRKDLLVYFDCPFWELVVFPPCPPESPNHSCQTSSVLRMQHTSHTG